MLSKSLSCHQYRNNDNITCPKIAKHCSALHKVSDKYLPNDYYFSSTADIIVGNNLF